MIEDLTGCIAFQETNKSLLSKLISLFQKFVVNVFRGKRKELHEYLNLPHVLVFLTNDVVYESTRGGVRVHRASKYCSAKLHIYEPVKLSKEERMEAIHNNMGRNIDEKYGTAQLLFGYIISLLARCVFLKLRKVPFSNGIVCSELMTDLIYDYGSFDTKYAVFAAELTADDINRVSPLGMREIMHEEREEMIWKYHGTTRNI